MPQSIAVVRIWDKGDYFLCLTQTFPVTTHIVQMLKRTGAMDEVCGDLPAALDACKRLLLESQCLAPGATQSVTSMPLSPGGGDTGAGLRHAAVLLQADKIRKAFGVASQRAAREASSKAPAPPAVVSGSQQEAMSDLLQRVLEL